MSSTQLILLNYPVILSHHWRSTTVSVETYPFIHVIGFSLHLIGLESGVSFLDQSQSE